MLFLLDRYYTLVYYSPAQRKIATMRTSTERLRELAERIREMEAGGRAHGTAIPLGISGLAEIFPEGLPGGSLLELLAAEEGAGLWTLALAMAKEACGERKGLLIADPRRSFYPPAAARWGIDLERTIVVRPRTAREAVGAAAESLRCPAVGAVIGWFERLGPTDFRCLQLAAEAGGGVGLLLRPGSAQGSPSFAAARLVVSPVPSSNGRRWFALEAARCRGGKAGTKITVEIDDEAGSLRVPAALAAAKTAARASGASR